MLGALLFTLCLFQSADLEKGLKAKEVEVRLATVQLLTRDTDPKTEKLLANAARDDDWEVALLATVGLGERKAQSTADALVKLALEAPIRRIRTAAARSLGEVDADEGARDLSRKLGGNDALNALEALALVIAGRETKYDVSSAAKLVDKAKDGDVCAAAAAVVAAGTGKDRDKVLDKILNGPSIRSACAALDFLCVSMRPGDRERLLALLMKPVLDDCVERRTIRAVRNDLVSGEKPLDADLMLAALKPLLESRLPAVCARGVRLIESLIAKPAAAEAADESAPSTGGAAPAEAAPAAAVIAADKLLSALQPALLHTDSLPRALAARTLIAVGGDAARERAQVLALSDKSPRVRRAAFEALCALAPIAEEAQRAVAVQLLANDSDDEVRRTAAVRLGSRGLGEAVGPLTAALADRDWGVGVCAAVSLGLTQAGPAIEPLARLAQGSPDWKLRAAAVVGLSRLYLKSAIPPTIEALADTDPFVVKCAHAQLIAISGEKFEPKREPWLEWWKKTQSSLIIVDPVTQAEFKKRFGNSGTAAPEIFRDLDVVVLEHRGDHIETVLARQKIAHRLTRPGQVAASGLSSDGLFVANCAGEIEESDVERLRWFVFAGGHLFGSCWALHETIERALPGVIAKFATSGEVMERVEAKACHAESPFLEGVFTPGTQPIFALVGAHVIDVLQPERAEVLVDSPECADGYGSGNMVAWFEAGHGTVLDSANHFEAQGLEGALNLKKPIDRQAYAVDHMGLALDQLRRLKGADWWDNSLKASREISDTSVFRLVTNFVRLRRLKR
ncbi:MAG: HEAT repeat domain-containing protein [Planctomycetes bacterium]|nr:HEAT repeat domain-containing protein [Planctomycetota bacterium]